MKKLILLFGGLCLLAIPPSTTAAPPPVGLCSGSYVHCINLSWTPPTLDVNGDPITGTITYDAYRSTTSGGGYTKISISPISSAAFEDDAITGGVTYYYVVVAYQTIGVDTSSPSANSSQIAAAGLPIPAFQTGIFLLSALTVDVTLR